jgi:hypothetical protein
MSSYNIVRMYQRDSGKTPGLDEQTTTGAWLFVARTDLNAPAPIRLAIKRSSVAGSSVQRRQASARCARDVATCRV